ncbi:MAG: M20/M25/M40 family metallo-hydrolase [Actinobacteria bacterium]|nr:M20/M25/M40 family metallo-hydrolase [Actinomycetota bacterium]
MPGAAPSEVVELVQQMIRNKCVNDGSAESGEEVRNASLLADYLHGAGIDVERYEPATGRTSLVARIEGSDPDAPSLCLLGHTDVVPVNEERWTHDPFGGELIDGYVWGRGAIDMFNLTGSMAVAFRNLATSGFKPKGTLIYIAVADEEAMGLYGAEHLTAHEADAVRCDYLITESGGMPMPSPAGMRLPALVEEKGPMWSRIKVRGTPGHGSMPFGTDNAIVTAGEVVRRLAAHRPPARIGETWRSFVAGLGFPEEMAGPLLQPEGFDDVCAVLPPGLAKMAHACTHTTITPTVVKGGDKTNIIPDTVEIELDVRVLPGDGAAQIREQVADALGDLMPAVELFVGREDTATSSPAGTPLWEAMTRAASRFYPDASLVPMLMPGASDARWFRRNVDAVAYGFGIFSTNLGLEQLSAMGHGDDERVDVESLDMAVELWDALARDFLG